MNKLVNCLLVNDKDIPDPMNSREQNEFQEFLDSSALFGRYGTPKSSRTNVMGFLFTLFTVWHKGAWLRWPADADVIAVRTAGALPTTLHGPVVGGGI